MPFTIYIEDDTPILVDLKPVKVRGEQEVALNPNDLIEKSSKALGNAMSTIYGISKRVVGTLNELPIMERPAEVEIEFGLSLKADASAFVVNAGAEAQITVTLKWQRNKKDDE